MWKVPKWMYIIVVVPFFAVGIGMIIFGLTSSPEELTQMDLPVQENLIILGALFMIMPFLSSLGLMMFYKRINSRETNLIKNGLLGEAEIISRQQTGIYFNELPQIKFKLKITSPYGEIYQIEHKDVVNMLDLGVITVGAKLPVYIDPNNEKNILLIYEPIKESDSI